MPAFRAFPGWTVGLAVAATTMLIAACASRGTAPGGQMPQVPATGPEQVVGVVLREFEFEPRPLKVKAGLVRFQLMNRGTVEHDFVIPALQAHEEHERHLLKPGESRVVELQLKPGT